MIVVIVGETNNKRIKGGGRVMVHIKPIRVRYSVLVRIDTVCYTSPSCVSNTGPIRTKIFKSRFARLTSISLLWCWTLRLDLFEVRIMSQSWSEVLTGLFSVESGPKISLDPLNSPLA